MSIRLIGVVLPPTRGVTRRLRRRSGASWNEFCRVPYNERGTCIRNRQSKKGMKGQILLKIKGEGGSIGVGKKKLLAYEYWR